MNIKKPHTTDIRKDANVVLSTIRDRSRKKVVIMDLGQLQRIIQDIPENVPGLFDQITYLGVRDDDTSLALYTGAGTPTLDDRWNRVFDMNFAIPHGTDIPWISFRTILPLNDKKTLLNTLFAPRTKVPLGQNIRNFRLTRRDEDTKKGSAYYTFSGKTLPLVNPTVKLDTIIPLSGKENRVLLGKKGTYYTRTFNVKTGVLEQPKNPNPTT